MNTETDLKRIESSETKALKRLVTRQLGLTKRQPDPPSDVQLSADGSRLTWKPPKNRIGLSTFRIWIDTDGGPPAFELLPGQCSVTVASGTRFFVASHNGPMDLTSRKVRVSARSTAAGLEHAPSILGLSGSVERRTPDGGNEEWAFALSWSEASTDPRFRFTAGYTITLEDGAGNRTRLVELPRGTTAYISGWMAVPAAAEAFKVWVTSRSTLGGENGIVPGVTPCYEATVAHTLGGSGVEYAGNVVAGVPVVSYLPTSDGTQQAHVSFPFTPPSDATWGSLDLVSFDGVSYRTLSRADSTSPAEATITPPDTVQVWTLYLVSRDTSGRRNGIIAGTPHADIAIGSASGQLNGARLIAGSVSTVHLDAEGVSVGGGGGKPGVFAVYNASGTQNGFIGMDGKRTGVVNTSGTAVTRTSGDVFVAAMAGLPISINSVIYTVASVGGPSSLTLTGSAGTQTGKAYIGWTGQGIWGSELRAGGTSFSAYKFRAHTTGVEIIDGSLSLNKNGTRTEIRNLYDSDAGSYVGLRVSMEAQPNKRAVVAPGAFYMYNAAGDCLGLWAPLVPDEAFGGLMTGYVNALVQFQVDTKRVVMARKTGWATATGTATRTTFDTSTVTLPQLAERLKALIDDLHATAGHGLIGTT